MKSKDWLRQVKPDIEAWMAEYEEGQIEFAILSLVKDPLLELRVSLASNVKAIQLASARLDELQEDWREFTLSQNARSEGVFDKAIVETDGTFDLTQEMIDNGILPENFERVLLSDTVDDLVSSYQELVTAQVGVRRAIKEELKSNRLDEAKAVSRRFDYGPLLQTWIRYHAQHSIIQSLRDSTNEW